MDDNTKDILELLVFIKERMATKDDIAELKESVDKLESRMTAVESKIGGIHTRIDDETASARNSSKAACAPSFLISRRLPSGFRATLFGKFFRHAN